MRLGLSEPVLRLAGVVAEVGGAQAADVEGEAPPAALLVEQLTVSLVQLLVAPEPRYLQGSGMSSSGITCISTSIFRQGHTYTNGLSGKFELHCNFLTPSPLVTYTGWGDGVTKKQTNGTKSAEFCM